MYEYLFNTIYPISMNCQTLGTDMPLVQYSSIYWFIDWINNQLKLQLVEMISEKSFTKQNQYDL